MFDTLMPIVTAIACNKIDISFAYKVSIPPNCCGLVMPPILMLKYTFTFVSGTYTA